MSKIKALSVTTITSDFHRSVRLLAIGLFAWNASAFAQPFTPALATQYTAFSSTFAAANKAVILTQKKLAAGFAHTLRAMPDGSVQAFGSNEFGQLGDGTFASQTAPKTVPGLSDVVEVAAGELNSFALTSTGRVVGWGLNGDGQTIGKAGYALLPTAVLGVANAKSVAAGTYFAMALRTDGTLLTWGSNLNGELGRPDVYVSQIIVGGPPVGYAAGQVRGLPLISAIAAGRNTAYALGVDGSVWAWGQNIYAQAGQTGINIITSPLRVSGLPAIVAIAAASNGPFAGHALALDGNGVVWGWGRGSSGQLGAQVGRSGTSVPVALVGIPPIKDIAAGREHTLLLDNAGSVWGLGWGADGQLGSAVTFGTSNPVELIRRTDISRVYAASDNSFVTFNNSAPRAWGANYGSSLGLGDWFANVPRRQTIVPKISTASVSTTHALVTTEAGDIFAWGANQNGQLGDGSTAPSVGVAKKISIGGPVRSIAAGDSMSLAVRSDGTLFFWGDGNSSPVPALTPTAKGTPIFSSVVAAPYNAAALSQTGDVYDLNDLATGNPVRVTGLPVVRKIAVGPTTGYAIGADGALWTWSPTSSGAPVAGVGGVISVAAGTEHVLALARDGAVLAWGRDSDGQLGLGAAKVPNQLATSTPLPIPGLSDIVDIAAAGNVSIALRSNGVVMIWGKGFESRPLPLPVPDRIARIFMGGTNSSLSPNYTVETFLVAENGQTYTMGSNAYGISGVGYAAVSNVRAGASVYDPQPSAQNSTEVVEFFTDQIGASRERFFLSAHPSSSAVLDVARNADGSLTWNRTGRGFRAWETLATAPAGASEVYRFYCVFADGKPNTHFYTSNPADRATLQALNPSNVTGQGCRYEGVDFYSVAPNFAFAKDPNPVAACPTGYQPVYRAFNNRSAQNDGNHRMSTSYIDHIRSIRYLGYQDEGVVFCSPTSTAPGGDLHAYHSYPRPEVRAGDGIKVEFVFANNGPGHGNGARISANVPDSVADWTVTCTARLGAVCPPSGSVSDLRNSTVVTTFPAGGTLTFALTGTAPSVTGTSTVELRFGNSILAAQGAPDAFSANDTTRFSSTQVKSASVSLSAVTCAYGLTLNQLSLAAVGGAATTAVATTAGCSLSATVSGATSGGQSVGSSWIAATVVNGSIASNTAANNVIKVTLLANSGPLSRAATVNVNGQVLNVFQEAPIPPSTNTNCIRQLSPSAEHAAATGYTSRSVAVSTLSSSCVWTAKTDSDWIALIANASGIGGGAVTYAILPNATETARSGKIQINNTALEIYQEPSVALYGGEGGAGDGGGDGGGSSGGGGEGPGGE